MLNRHILTLVGLLLFLSACGEAVKEDAPADGPFKSAAQYSREHNGLALLIYQGDTITYVDNQNGGSVDAANHIFSGTKSFNCALGIAAITDGLLTSFDEVVADTITEWQGVARKSTITVRQLLNFTSGLEQSLINLFLFATDSFAFSFATQAITNPGATFTYGEIHHGVFSELMRRKLLASGTYSSLDPLAYLKRRVFDPIGMNYDVWLRTDGGQPFLSLGAFITAREWLKYGILLRDSGVFNGNTVLNNALLTECLTGSAAQAGYGLNFWLNAATPSGFSGISLAEYTSLQFAQGGPTGLIWPGGDTDLFAAVGVNDNRLYILRSRNMVIVRMGRGGAWSSWSDATFLNKIFGRE